MPIGSELPSNISTMNESIFETKIFAWWLVSWTVGLPFPHGQFLKTILMDNTVQKKIKVS